MSNSLLSIKDALNSDTFTLGEIIKVDRQGLQSWLITSIGVMLEYYGFKADCNVSLTQLNILIDDICEKYRAFTIADLIMCFKLARQNPSQYGKFYGRFDASVVMGWLDIYAKERSELFPSLNENNAPVYKPSPDDMTREKYIKGLLHKSLHGHRESWMNYCRYVEGEMWRKEIAGQTAVYNWNMKHRFDKR